MKINILNQIINFFEWIIPLAIKHIYSFMLFMNKNIFLKLDTSLRLDAYIGVLSILVAIVIFIVELVKDSDKVSEFQKRFILNATNIKKTTIVSLVILMFYFLKQILVYDENILDDNLLINITYFIFEIILNYFIIKSIINTIRLFTKTIKLNSDSDYYYKEYNLYVKKCLDSINRKNISNTSKKMNNNRFKKFMDTNEKYFSSNKEDYKESNFTLIKSTKSGIFKCYSTNVLQSISDKIDESLLKRKEQTLDNDPVVILLVNPGDKLNHGVSIAYLRNDFLSIANDVRESVILQDSIPFQDNDLNLILNDLYSFTLDKKNNSFKDLTMLMDFYNYLYQKNMSKVLCLAYEYIRELLPLCEDLEQNKKMVRILNVLLSIAYANEDYEYYKMLSSFMYYCYKRQLSKTDDIRDTIYSYTNEAFRYEYYSLKKNNDKSYFDVMMSNVLNIVFDLLELKEFDAICDIFENVYFEHVNYRFDSSEELNEYDIVKLQFTFGFIYSLIILHSKSKFTEEDIPSIKRIISYIKNNFVDVYDVEDAIYYFKKYFNYYSNVEEVYERLDFRYVNKKYRNSWSGICIDYIFVLKSFLYLFNINFASDDIRHSTLISRNEKYYYERLISIISEKEKNNSIESFLKINYNESTALKKINNLLEKSKLDEEEYIREHDIQPDKFKQFYNLLIKKITDGSNLYNYLKKNKKIINSKEVSKKMLGFNQVIDRDIFFEDVYGVETLADSYAHSMNIGISKEYIDKIDEKSVVCSTPFEEYIKNMEEDNNIILTSPFNLRTMNIYDYNKGKIEINGKQIDVILEPKAKHIYIMNKHNVPSICYRKIDEKGLLKKNNIYYKIIDCSKDDSVRKDIINSSDWIKEIGDEKMQDMYLRGKCLFKLFVSTETIVSSEAIINKFECEDDE